MEFDVNVGPVAARRSSALRVKRLSRRYQTGRGWRPMVRERIRTVLRFKAEVQVIDGFDGDGTVVVDRRMRDDIDDERLAPLGGGASERRDR